MDCVTNSSKVRDPTVELMEHYRDAKEKHPGMLMLFRAGNSYALYGEDAQTAARDLGLGLTQGAVSDTHEMVFMAGFPQQALEDHLRRLLQLGHRVAICGSWEDVASEETVENAQPTLENT